MTFNDTTAYFLTLVAIALAPGPVVLMLIARAASRDTMGAMSFGVGFACGGVLIITAVCFGLGGWLQAAPQVFEYGKYAMLAYILYLARGIWTSGFDAGGTDAAPASGLCFSFFAGVMSCAISPYMMILFPLVLPSVVDINTLNGMTFSLISVTTFTALGTGAAIIILFASQLRRLSGSPRHVAILNRSLACLLASGGGYMALA